MILTTTYDGNPIATVLNGSEKFMSLKKHQSPNFTVAFSDILQNNEKLIAPILEQKVKLCNPVSVSCRTNS